MNGRYFIWSLEHRAWWRDNQRGYTTDRAKAGLYPLAEAMRICMKANQYIPDDQPPNEALVPLTPAELQKEWTKAFEVLIAAAPTHGASSSLRK